VLAHGFVEVAQEGGHAGLRNGLPRLFEQQHLADAFQPAHLRKEGFHDRQRDDRIKDLVVRHVVQLEDHEAFVEQIETLVGVEQIAVFALLVVRFQHVEKVRQIEILLPHTLLPQQCAVVRCDELVEGIERGYE